jgi:hypothetical protein
MQIRFARSASRHGISHERSRFVVERCSCPLYSSDPDDADLIVFLGPDRRGVALEVVALEVVARNVADGAVLVIHAMKLRRAYRADYARVMACQGW